MESSTQTPPLSTSSESAARSPWLGPAVWLAVLGVLVWFFSAMAQIEPLTGDGWYNADEARDGVSVDLLVKQLTHLHNNGNPRIGQAFTLLTYGSRTFHLIATPLVTIALMILIAAHALGRWPSPRSARDGLMLLIGTAACFLAVPQPGHAFFYRPITTNYLYTLTLSLAFFVPQRFDLRLRSRWATALAGLLALACGVFIGKTNEHTGPTMVLVAAGYTAYAWREGQAARRDVIWRGLATLGVIIGYLFLFFAPGQSRRYGALGRQSLFETIFGRGLLDTATLFGEYCTYVGPLLFVSGLLGLLCLLLKPRDPVLPGPQSSSASVVHTVLGYVLVSCLVLGTTLAAPKNHYRLFIAPAVLLVIAAVAALRLVHGRWSWTAIAVSGAVACGVTMGIFLPMYGAIHEDELARNAIIESADPKQAVIVPRTRFAKRNSYYYGDSLTADPRHRDRAAHLFGVREIKMIPKAVQEEQDKKKAAKKKKKKATFKASADALSVDAAVP